MFGDYWLQWGTTTNDALLDFTFIAGVPGLLVMLIGSTMLGTALLRNGFRPPLTAWLLVVTIPFAFLIEMVTSMGSIALPVMFAFGIAGHRFVSDSPAAATGQTADESVLAPR